MDLPTGVTDLGLVLELPLGCCYAHALATVTRLRASAPNMRNGVQGQRSTGPDDGLDGLLKGLEDLVGATPDGLDSAHSSDDEVSDGEDDAMSDSSAFESLGEDAGANSGGEVEDAAWRDSEVESDQDNDGASERSTHSGSDDRGFEEFDSGLEGDSGLDEGQGDDVGLDIARSAEHTDRAAAAARGTVASAGTGSSGAKYVPPALRGTAGGADAATVIPEVEVARRRVRGLLNRAASANLERSADAIAELFNAAPRHAVIGAIVDTIMQVRRCC
jgi:hypothetical protein